MSQTMHIGIDPGLSGAIGVIHPEGTVIHDIPTVEIKNGKRKSRLINHSLLIQMFRALVVTANASGWETIAYLEDVHSMPGQGVRSMFSMGRTYGNLEMLIKTMDVRLERIPPQRWKKKIMAGMGKEKAASCYKASEIFPELDFFGPRGGAMDGRGDAMLIAEYGRVTYGEGR